MSKNPIKILIVDDEPLARRFIRELLKNDSDVCIVGESGNGADALEKIVENKPDIVFLDVQMPEVGGLAMLERLAAAERVEPLPLIIFTTAYEEYAVRAFEFHALDYLLKPFDAARFRQSLDYAKERLQNSRGQIGETEQISELLRYAREKPKFLERLLIKSNGRIVFLKTAEIDWLKANDKYVQLRAGKSLHLVRQPLGALRDNLDPALFVQVNRSTIVNVERIKELQPMFAGDYTVLLEDNTEFALSRNFKDAVFARLGKPF